MSKATGKVTIEYVADDGKKHTLVADLSKFRSLEFTTSGDDFQLQATGLPDGAVRSR